MVRMETSRPPTAYLSRRRYKINRTFSLLLRIGTIPGFHRKFSGFYHAITRIHAKNNMMFRTIEMVIIMHNSARQVLLRVEDEHHCVNSFHQTTLIVFITCLLYFMKNAPQHDSEMAEPNTCPMASSLSLSCLPIVETWVQNDKGCTFSQLLHLLY